MGGFNVFPSKTGRSGAARKGSSAYDNPRENIDPHVKTKVINSKEGIVNTLKVKSSDTIFTDWRKYSFPEFIDADFLQLSGNEIRRAFVLATSEGDASVQTTFSIWGLGNLDSTPTSESLNFEWNISENAYEIFTSSNGTGTRRPLYISGDELSHYLYFATDGKISINNTIIPAGADFHVDGTINFNGDLTCDGTVVIDTNRFFLPTTDADADAPNNSVYYSTDQSKLVYKDAWGIVHTLY